MGRRKIDVDKVKKVALVPKEGAKDRVCILAVEENTHTTLYELDRDTLAGVINQASHNSELVCPIVLDAFPSPQCPIFGTITFHDKKAKRKFFRLLAPYEVVLEEKE